MLCFTYNTKLCKSFEQNHRRIQSCPISPNPYHSDVQNSLASKEKVDEQKKAPQLWDPIFLPKPISFSAKFQLKNFHLSERPNPINPSPHTFVSTFVRFSATPPVEGTDVLFECPQNTFLYEFFLINIDLNLIKILFFLFFHHFYE
jgi:hypothetical protein